MSIPAVDATRREPVPNPGIAEAAQALGVSAHAVRYYEREGLVQIPRDPAGNRVFDEAAMSRLTFLVRMRASGMGIATLRHYVELADRGAATIPDRLHLMLAHRQAIEEQIAQLRLALAATDHKIATYGGNLGAVTPATTGEAS